MTTRVAARRAILAGLGRGGVATTTSAGVIGGGTLVCTDFLSTLLPADFLDRAWVHVPTATSPRQRRVAASGLTIASGTVTFESTFGSQIGISTVFEWSPLLPLITAPATGETPSIEDALYEALRHLAFPDEISPSIATTADISLATWAAWLDRSDRLLAVLEPAPVASLAPIDASYRFEGHTARLLLDGETPKLRLNVLYPTATGSLTLQVLRPADTWFRVSGTWTETAPGTALAAETDEVRPDLRHCREAGLVFCYQALAASREGARRAEYQAKYEQQLAIARDLPFWDHSRDDLLPRPGDEGKAPATEAA